MVAPPGATAVPVFPKLGSVVKHGRLGRLDPLRAQERVQHFKSVLVLVRLGPPGCTVPVGVRLVAFGVRIAPLVVGEAQGGENVRAVPQSLPGGGRQGS